MRNPRSAAGMCNFQHFYFLPNKTYTHFFLSWHSLLIDVVSMVLSADSEVDTCMLKFNDHENGFTLCSPVCLLLHYKPLECVWFLVISTFRLVNNLFIIFLTSSIEFYSNRWYGKLKKSIFIRNHQYSLLGLTDVLKRMMCKLGCSLYIVLVMQLCQRMSV